ncbi:hypothetical protein GCM10007907_38670 [Chitinimonas prasina]|uniref:Uncharacterized protein n=1 Tax=Chitinimonas prasina TaxID=1434937 RepID=A0ABQ5YJ86_9NEIS|nr:DUF4844 domain-containing protein [Chitinimonas prasina]GLR15077.1 hypothetical protein GCM10007907_38670 [Chitinimonas prasina]
MRFALALTLALVCSIPFTASADDSKQVAAPVSQTQLLTSFIAKKKYLPDGQFAGVGSESARVEYEALLNALATRLLAIADQPSPKAPLLAAFKTAYPDFQHAESGVRERTLSYFEELMDILGVQSSDGLLNRLYYGFDPSQTTDMRNADAVAAMTEQERAFAKRLDGLNEQSALPFLMQELGKPAMQSSVSTIWIRESEPGNMLSLVQQQGKSVLIWVIEGRFVFSRIL